MDVNDGCLLENSSLSDLQKFLINKEFSDVKLIIGGKSYDVHKVVLASQSPFFERLFSDIWNQGNVITLDEEFLDPEIIEDLLNFMYSKVYLTPANVNSLLRAAHFLQMKKFLRGIDWYLSQNISIDNAFALFKLCNNIHLLQTVLSVEGFIRSECKKILQNPYIQELSNQDVVNVFYIFCLHEDSEIYRTCLFNFIIDWIENDKENRLSYLEDFMKKLEDFLTFDFLVKKVVTDHFFAEYKCSSTNLLMIHRKMRFYEEELRPIHHRKLISFCSKGKDDGELLRDIEIFDLEKFRSSFHDENLLPKISNFGFASFGSKIYFAGGKNENGTASKELRIFNCHTKKWKIIGEIPEGRYDCSIAYLNDYLYITGGYDVQNKPLSSVVRYCLTTKTWANVPPMLEPRANHQLIRANGSLYAIGGQTKNIEEYTPQMNKWKVVWEFENISSWTSAAVYKCEMKSLEEKTIKIILDKKIGSFDVFEKKFKFEKKEIPFHCNVVSFETGTFIIFEDGNFQEYDPYQEDDEDGYFDVELKGKYFVACQY